MEKEVSFKELKSKIAGLGDIDIEKKKEIICTFIGHSLIQTSCFGYKYCGRCGEQVGDSLGGIWYDAEKAVLAGHNCKTCRANFKKLSWREKLYCRNPFAKNYDKSKYILTLSSNPLK